MKKAAVNKRSLPELVTRLVLFLIGMAVIAAGTSIFVLSDTGSDPFAVLCRESQTLCISRTESPIWVSTSPICW